MMRWQRLITVTLWTSAAAALGAEPAVKPLAEHPGNIFLAGEAVTIPLPEKAGTAWLAVDSDGHIVKDGHVQDGQAQLGPLGVGYYQVTRTGSPPISAGVVTPLVVRPSATSPIGIDVAMAWFYKEPQMPAVANLCALAGINSVRDRLRWADMEPQRGQWSAPNQYDATAQAQSAAGLRVLTVNHSTPPWAGAADRFPPDLRDAYNFYRAMAQRWAGKVAAFEPWNEADIPQFGGHTGAEMASLQKAAYLGLKAGNPNVIACQNVFADNRPAEVEDLAANGAAAYFDTCNLHHYTDLDQYPQRYAPFRAIAGGRPLWVTEFDVPVRWAGAALAQEPTAADLELQARRVPMVFATALHEGPAAAFYFRFPHYVEGQIQFGLVHRDLTPRPGYLAMAAVGRLLAEARPLGQIKVADPHGRAYIFSARPDGNEQEVVVGWAAPETCHLPLPLATTATFDYLGRALPGSSNQLTLSARPLYALLPPGTAARLNLTPPPGAPSTSTTVAQPSPIVLQAIWPQAHVDLDQSAYRLTGRKGETIPVFVYNFGTAPAQGTLTASGPTDWTVHLPGTLEIAPGERKELALSVNSTPQTRRGTVIIKGDLGTAGQTILSLRLAAGP